MSIFVRCLLIACVWCLGALICCLGTNRHPGSTFDTEKAWPPRHGEKPFYKEEIINARQDIPFVHVASLIELEGGGLAGLWYGGPFEYCHDNKIYFSKVRNASWMKPSAIMTSERAEGTLGRPIRCLGNPLMFRSPDGTLRLLFVTVAIGRWSGGQLNCCQSSDGGLTWSPPERLTLSPLCNFSELVRNRPIPLVGGGTCVPIYQELIGKFPELLWITEMDGRVSVRKTRIAGGCATLQPSLIPLGGKRAIVLLRDWTQAKKIFLSRSSDGGLIWTKPTPTSLPNPDSGISGLRLRDGKLLVAYNDSIIARSNISLALSNDEGLTWRKIAMIENDPDESFSYPYLMQSSDGLVHIAYTWNADTIKMASFNDSWVREQEAKGAIP